MAVAPGAAMSYPAGSIMYDVNGQPMLDNLGRARMYETETPMMSQTGQPMIAP